MHSRAQPALAFSFQLICNVDKKCAFDDWNGLPIISALSLRVINRYLGGHFLVPHHGHEAEVRVPRLDNGTRFLNGGFVHELQRRVRGNCCVVAQFGNVHLNGGAELAQNGLYYTVQRLHNS